MYGIFGIHYDDITTSAKQVHFTHMDVGNLALILTQSDSPNTHRQPHRYAYTYVQTYVHTYMRTYMAILAAIDAGSSQGTMNHQAFS